MSPSLTLRRRRRSSSSSSSLDGPWGRSMQVYKHIYIYIYIYIYPSKPESPSVPYFTTSLYHTHRRGVAAFRRRFGCLQRQPESRRPRPPSMGYVPSVPYFTYFTTSLLLSQSHVALARPRWCTCYKMCACVVK